jgi:hypothetical protein
MPRTAWIALGALFLFSARSVHAQAPFGTTGDIRINGDFDGDGYLDYAIWRPANGSWYVYPSGCTGGGACSSPGLMTKQWGLPGDIPVPGDYDGDGKTDYAVYRPPYGLWFIILSSTGQTVIQQWGLPGDIPVPADYDGDGKTDFAVYRPSLGGWYVLQSKTGTQITRQNGGQIGDTPFTGDFDGDGQSEMVIYRPSNGTFYALTSSSTWNSTFSIPVGASSSDIPFVGDFDGDGRMDYAVWRPYDPHGTSGAPDPQGFGSGGNLHVVYGRDLSTAIYPSLPPSELLSTKFKVPGFPNSYAGRNTATRVYNRVEGDWDGDGQPDFALFDPQNGNWFLVPSTNPSGAVANLQYCYQAYPISGPVSCKAALGLTPNVPIAADYDGDGKTDFAAYDRADSLWYIIQSSQPGGGPSSVLNLALLTGINDGIVQPGDYDGDGHADFAVWRPVNGSWYIIPFSSVVSGGNVLPGAGSTLYTQQWGLPGDIPVAADVDGDRVTDFVVYRPTYGLWWVVPSATNGICTMLNCVAHQSYSKQWGLPIGDQPMVGDFNGDGKADLLIWRSANGTFYGQSSTGSPISTLSIGVAGNGLIRNEPPLTPSFGSFNFGFF